MHSFLLRCWVNYQVSKILDELPLVALRRSLERRIDAEPSESVPLENRVLVRRRLFSLGGALVSEQ